jgi:glyoxylase-like metal-dependent hydrolase (beta-lactamase superfamily II)
MPHYSLPNIELFCFPSGPLGTNCYLVICKKTKQAAVIDPASDSWLLVTRACEKSGATLTKVIITHSHWDHIADAAKFVKAQHIPVLIHEEDAPNLRNPGADGLSCWLSIEPVEPTAFLKEHGSLSVGDWQCRVIHTPGHSPGGICLYDQADKILISGDTLFKGSLGRLDLPTGEPERMWASLKKLALLDPDTQVFPGHGPPTTIGNESWLTRAEEIFGKT